MTPLAPLVRRLLRPQLLFFALATALGLSIGAGCRTLDPGTSGTGTTATEPSVKPGINAEYLKPNLDATPWVERFEREGREIFDRRVAIADALQLKPGMVVADIGSGTGLFTPFFSKAVGPRGKVLAVDIVPAFLARIRGRAATEGLTNVETILCTERSVELPPNSIDVAFICDVYHHFEYPRSSMESLHRALRPGGRILVVEFRRIPGVSSDWILNHVRADQQTVTAEIESAGFRKIEELDLLKDNYIDRFRKVRR